MQIRPSCLLAGASPLPLDVGCLLIAAPALPSRHSNAAGSPGEGKGYPLQPMGWERVGHNWATFTYFHFYFALMYNPHPWRRKWQPTPVFLPGKFHRQRSLTSYSPWGHKESGTVEHTRTTPIQNYTPIQTKQCCDNIVLTQTSW